MFSTTKRIKKSTFAIHSGNSYSLYSSKEFLQGLVHIPLAVFVNKQECRFLGDKLNGKTQGFRKNLTYQNIELTNSFLHKDEAAYMYTYNEAVAVWAAHEAKWLCKLSMYCTSENSWKMTVVSKFHLNMLIGTFSKEFESSSFETTH